MVMMDNLKFYLLKCLKQQQTYIFCFKIFIYFIFYLSKTFCPHQIFKLLKMAHI